jgi:hypothetical protein
LDEKNYRFYADKRATETGSPNGGNSGARVGESGQHSPNLFSDLNKSETFTLIRADAAEPALQT